MPRGGVQRCLPFPWFEPMWLENLGLAAEGRVAADRGRRPPGVRGGHRTRPRVRRRVPVPLDVGGGQRATLTIGTLPAGDQAATEVTSAAGDLDDLFGNQGPVQGWINSQPGLGEDFPPGDPVPPEIEGPEVYPLPPDLGLPEGDPIPPEIGGPEVYPLPPNLGPPEGDPIPPGLLGPLINYNSPTEDEREPEEGDDEGDEGTPQNSFPSFEEWLQNNEWDYSYVDDDGYQTPGSNQAQNEAFDSGVREAESQLGRQLSKDEIQRLHMEISGQGLGRDEIIERAITMFGGS
jgi:hypothetical protein